MRFFWADFAARYASDNAPVAALVMASGLAWLGGIRALESRGFVKSAKFTSHRSVIYEFTRQHTSAWDFRTFGRSLRGTPRNRR